MSDYGELSFCELRSKEVVNSTDGRRLGRITDIVFSGCGGELKGIIVPYNRKGWFKSQDMFIPWQCVKKIGEDVIIVELTDFRAAPAKKNEPIRCAPPPPPPHEKPCPPPEQCAPPHGKPCPPHGEGRRHDPPPEGDRPDCDGKCEKCMLFDCRYRWSDYVRGAGIYVDGDGS